MRMELLLRSLPEYCSFSKVFFSGVGGGLDLVGPGELREMGMIVLQTIDACGITLTLNGGRGAATPWTIDCIDVR